MNNLAILERKNTVELVAFENEGMTSLEIAELIGKRHADVMRDIRDEISKLGDEIAERIFALSEYKDITGRKLPMYNCTSDGVMQLAARYDAMVRYKLIQKAKELQSGFKAPQTYAEALEIAAQQAKLIENQEKKIKTLQPKADYYDNVLVPDHVFAVAHIAKDLGISSTKLNKTLEKLKIQYNPKVKHMPWALYSKFGWLVPQHCDYEDFKNEFMSAPSKQLKWSQKGREWIIDTLDEAGYIDWYDGKPRFKDKK